MLKLPTFIRDSTFALVDQGIAAITTLIISLIAARNLTSSEFGSFAVCITVLTIVAGLHSAFIVEPALILRPSTWPSTASYLPRIIRLHLMLTVALGLLVIAWSFYSPAGHALLVSGSVLPAYLMYQLARRWSYADSTPHYALAASVQFSGLAILIAWAFIVFTKCTAALLITSLGICGFLSSIALFARPWEDKSPSLLDVIRSHTKLGGWLAAASLCYVPLQQAQLLMLSENGSLEDTAALRGMGILLAPALQIYSAMSAVLIPRLAKHAATGLDPNQQLPRLLLYLVGTAILGTIPLVLAPSWCEQLIFARNLTDQPNHLRWYALLLPITGFVAASVAVLEARHQTKAVFTGFLCGGGVGLLTLAWTHTVAGSIWSILCANLTAAIILVTLASRPMKTA